MCGHQFSLASSDLPAFPDMPLNLIRGMSGIRSFGFQNSFAQRFPLLDRRVTEGEVDKLNR